jgi:hypothetical protein
VHHVVSAPVVRLASVQIGAQRLQNPPLHATESS